LTAETVAEARKAVELDPDEQAYRNTLGVALYRAGQFTDAVPALMDSLRLGQGKADAFDLFFLAMCHYRLGDAAKAKDCRRDAASWFESHKSKLPAGWVVTHFR
jgi:Flp pilus assembly protein TadD